MVSPYSIHIPDERLAAIMAESEGLRLEPASRCGRLGCRRRHRRPQAARRLLAGPLRLAHGRATPQRAAQLHDRHRRRTHTLPPLQGERVRAARPSAPRLARFVPRVRTDRRPPCGGRTRRRRALAPGFAFSRPISGIIGPRRAATLMHGLMARLFGPSRYVVQGGDWGAHIASWMACDRPDALLGFHINMVSVLGEDVEPTTPEEKDLMARRSAILDRETGYNHQQETRPQTLGVAMADSPVGAAGWILEKFGAWADLPKRADGSPDLWSRFSEEDLLTNIMLYIAPPRSSPRPGSTAASAWSDRTGFRLERGCARRWASRRSPIPSSCPRRARSSRRPTMSSIGAT